MTTLLDFILDLFRSPGAAAAYVADPGGALRDAGLPNVSAAQLASVAATAAPAGVFLGGGDPVVGLQRAVSDYHSFAASPFSPQTAFTSAPTWAPETNTDFASHNDTSFLSPDQNAGANAQQGAFNLGFGDITLGDKTTTSASNGGVVVQGDSSSPIVTGDGAVLGHGNTVNNGDVWAGSGSHVAVGEGNAIEDSSQHAGGNVISGNDGPVISGNDMSGGHGGNASASGSGGGLLNIGGSGGEANAGGGGSAGSIIIADDHTQSVAGDQTPVRGDYGSGNSTSLDSSAHTSTSTSSSIDNHSLTESSVHTDSSLHNDSSVHQSGGFSSNLGANTHSDTSLDAASHNDAATGFHGF